MDVQKLKITVVFELKTLVSPQRTQIKIAETTY